VSTLEPTRLHLFYRLRFLTVSVVVCLMLSADRASSQENHHFANLSLFYPVSTNKSTDVSTNFRLSLIHGKLGAVHGLDINGIVGLTKREVKGIQITGIYSGVGGEFGGLAITGAIHRVGGMSKGVQISGLANFNQESFAGLQFAGFFNYAQNDASGVQGSLVMNLVDSDAQYLQLSAFSNIVGNSFRGVQLAGGFNYTGQTVRGVQVALGNLAADLSGVQVGALNTASEVHGLQLGVINLSRKNNGIPIGLINIEEEGGETDLITFASTFSVYNIGIRTTVNRFYSMLTLGVFDVETERSEVGFATWNFGYSFPVSKLFSLGADLGYSHVVPDGSDDPTVNTNNHPALQARALIEARFSPKFSIFGGGGVVNEWSEYGSGATSEARGLGFLGVSLF